MIGGARGSHNPGMAVSKQFLGGGPRNDAAGMAGARVRPVLIVRGDPATDARIRRQLGLMNAAIETCLTGRAAIERAAQRALRCVIAPVTLADMNATTLIDRLRSAAPGLPVIVVVERPAVPAAVSVMQAGAHAVIDSEALNAGLAQYVAPLPQVD
jgi:DNA-binding NtrC family response regulator